MDSMAGCLTIVVCVALVGMSAFPAMRACCVHVCARLGRVVTVLTTHPCPPPGLQVPSLYQVQSLSAKNAWGAPRAYSFGISYTTTQLLPGEAACMAAMLAGGGHVKHCVALQPWNRRCCAWVCSRPCKSRASLWHHPYPSCSRLLLPSRQRLTPW